MNLTKRGLLGVSLAGIFVFVASAANAEVTVTGTVDKTKTINVTENIYITKYVTLTVDETIRVNAASEQDVVKNQHNYTNYVQDEYGLSSAEIVDDSGYGLTGIVLINQSPGFQNNQGNEVSIAYAASPGDIPGDIDTDGTAGPDVAGGVFTHAQISVSQHNYTQEVIMIEGTEEGAIVNSDTIGAPYEAGDIDTDGNVVGPGGPFAGGTGIVDINQAAGHQNNQQNGQSIALGVNTVFALGEIDLGQWNYDNYANVAYNTRSDVIGGGAFRDFTGIVKINQAAGSQNNQANLLNIAADPQALLNLFD